VITVARILWFAVVAMLWAGAAAAAPGNAAHDAAEPVDATSPPTTPAVPAVPVEPQKGEAEQHRQRALRFYDAGNYGAARAEFERANQLMASFRLLYNLGVVSMALGDSASAYDFFRRYLDEGGSGVPPEMRAEIELQLRDLSEHIATLVVLVDTPGAEVFVDDTPIGISPLAVPVHVNAGTRRVSARHSQRQADSQSVQLSEGETVRVRLTLAVPPPKVQPPGRPIFWAGWATTTALAGGAVLAGLEALAAQRQYQEQRGTVGTLREELDRSNARATGWSVAADTLGGAAIVVGAYSLYMTLRHTPAQRLAVAGSGSFALRLRPNQAIVALSF
jgi:hypothetical protein